MKLIVLLAAFFLKGLFTLNAAVTEPSCDAPPFSPCSIAETKLTYQLADQDPSCSMNVGTFFFAKTAWAERNSINCDGEVISSSFSGTYNFNPGNGVVDLDFSKGSPVRLTLLFTAPNAGLLEFDEDDEFPPIPGTFMLEPYDSKPKVIIELQGGPFQNGNFFINKTPEMPVVRARARLSGLGAAAQNIQFTWTASLDLPLPKNNMRSFTREIEQKKTTMDDGEYTLTFKSPGAFRGGRLKLTAKTVLNGKKLQGTTPENLLIAGENPDIATVEGFIDALAAAQPIDGLPIQDVSSILKAMACQESLGNHYWQFEQKGQNFGLPVVSFDLGVGLLQITRTPNCDKPLTQCPDTVFNWKANVEEAYATLLSKVKIARGYPKALRQNGKYRKFVETVINPRRLASGLKELPLDPPPVAEFTANQLLLDAVRGYNGYAGRTELEGRVIYQSLLHEFIPDTSFLSTATDDEAAMIESNPAFWQELSYLERIALGQQKGDRNYVANVQMCIPQ